MDLKTIIEQFEIKGEFRGYKVLSGGNINTTYELMLFDGEGIKTYVLQRINKFVFKKPDEVMENIMKVTEFIRSKYLSLGEDYHRQVLRYYRNKNGMPYLIDENGDYWRCYRFIEDSITYDNTINDKVICEAGKAFGNFQKMLRDFNAETLFDTIPNFHNTRKRLTDLFHSVIADECERVKQVKEELEYIVDNRNKAEILCNMLDAGEIPLRVTHNDTKLNNIMMDEKTLKPRVIVDLDTIMGGSMLYDFGDAIRFGASTASEDEKDLDKVHFDIDLFRAFAEGFCPEVKDSITKRERELLPYSAYLITLECGSRFLADYIAGDVYFGTKYPEHNLDRARTQFKLAYEMENSFDEMTKIIDEILG
jgi:hypothetical protein